MTLAKAEVIFTLLAACIRKLALRVDRANCMAEARCEEPPLLQQNFAPELGRTITQIAPLPLGRSA